MDDGRSFQTPTAGSFGRRNSAAARRLLVAAVLFIPLLTGCGGAGLETAGLPSPSQLSLPTLPAVPSLPDIQLPKPPPPVVGTPTEVYERIGRGAVSCWLGGTGPLKGTHLYEAAADSAHKGGRAEIAIRERDPSAPNPRGVKAFQIRIEPIGEEKAAVTAENLKLPDELARQMVRNVEAWGAGSEGCDAGGVVAGTAPEPATKAANQPPLPEPSKKRKPAATASSAPAPAQPGVGRASR